MNLLQQIKYIHKMSYYIYSNKYQAHVKVRDDNCYFSDFFQGFCEPVLLQKMLSALWLGNNLPGVCVVISPVYGFSIKSQPFLNLYRRQQGAKMRNEIKLGIQFLSVNIKPFFSGRSSLRLCPGLAVNFLPPPKEINQLMCLYKHLAAEQQHWRRDNSKKRWITQLTSSLCRYIDPWFGYYYCFSVHWSCSPTLVDRYQEMCQTMSDVSGGWWLVCVPSQIFVFIFPVWWT